MSTATLHIKKKKALVPKLRFQEFDEEWEKNILKEICTFFSGGTPTSTDKKLYNGNIPFIGSGNIYDTEVKNYITEEALNGSSAKLVKVGDILYALYGANSGEVAISKMQGAINQAILCIRTKSDFNQFVYYLLLSNKDKIVSKYLQGGQGNLSADIIKKLNYSFPTLLEQQKIASFLSAVDEKIQQLSRKKELLEQYKKGVMQQLFSGELRFKDENGKDYPDWDEKKLGEIAKYYDGTHQTPNYVESGIPFYSVEHVTANQFSKSKYISEEVFEKENKRVKLEKGDILMTRIGDIGTSRLIDWDVNASFYVSLALIKQNENYNSSFLNQYISSVYFQKELWANTIHVAFPKKINLGEIGKCKIILPCLKEQQKIATFLSSIDVKIERINQQINKMQSFKKGLLQQLFV
jgi:type I restriction enzyme, S subunit